MLVPIDGELVNISDWKSEVFRLDWGSNQLLDLIEGLSLLVDMGILDGKELDRCCELRCTQHWLDVNRGTACDEFFQDYRRVA